MKDLLTPRCEVIAGYFYSPYKVGDIIEPNENGAVHLTTTVQYDSFDGQNHDVVNYMPFETVTKYPHLFRAIAWHEKRDIKDMPEYVKFRNELVCKVVDWDKGVPTIDRVVSVLGYETDVLYPIILRLFLPATEEEYETFINNK
jgi:hypothetical protein